MAKRTFRKRTGRAAGRRRRRTTYGRKRTATVAKAFRAIKRLKTNIQRQIEYKHMDVSGTKSISAPVYLNTATQTVFELANGPPQGDTDTARDGDKIFMTSLTFKGQFKNNPVQLSESRLRMVVFMIRETTNSVDRLNQDWVAQIFNPALNASSTGYLLPSSLWGYNTDYMRGNNIKILMDRVFNLKANNPVPLAPPLLGTFADPLNPGQQLVFPQYFNQNLQVDTRQFVKKFVIRKPRQFKGGMQTEYSNAIMCLIVKDMPLPDGITPGDVPSYLDYHYQFNYSDL